MLAGRARSLILALVVASLCLTGAANAAAKPTCVGAAARDAKRPCFNPTRSVTPSLADADRVSTSPCNVVHEEPEPVCSFGVSAPRATKHIALLGDSHALQWRAPLDFAATAQGWRGYSLTAPGCPFSDAVKYLAEGPRGPCVEHNRAVLKWFRAHPEVTTVYTSHFAAVPFAAPGRTALEVKSAGFRRAWASLPRTVKRVIVIRDPPVTTPSTVDCLRDAIAAGTQRPGIACRLPRLGTLFDDAAVTTARQLRSRRYAFVDLTSYFCGQAYCYPVIGGVLVHRDATGHITIAYSESLGPYLLRKLRLLG